jgi:serine/threonine protein kinase
MVHRDIRSKNIVITDHDIAKITNFKFSRGFEEATSNIKIDEECVRYSAPEMLKRGITGEKNDKRSIKYDTKCEVYSFGILLWEIAECKIPYKNLGDFMEITKKVVGGYREKFTPETDIPKKYQDLVNKSVVPNPGSRPIFSKMLTVLQDIFRNADETSPCRTNSLNSNKHPITPPVRKSTLAAAEEDIGEIDWDSVNKSWETFDYMTLEKAIEYHKNNDSSKDKETLYKCFDTYAKMDNPRAKYWKAYYISKGWSNLDCSEEEKLKLSAQLFKAAADYDDMADAQLRYATMVMNGKGVERNKDEAIKYFLKAAKNGHLVAMFNIATYYYSNEEDEMGNYYMINAANKGYQQAIKYCEKKNISY